MKPEPFKDFRGLGAKIRALNNFLLTIEVVLYKIIKKMFVLYFARWGPILFLVCGCCQIKWFYGYHLLIMIAFSFLGYNNQINYKL